MRSLIRALGEIARLRLPVTAAAVVATVAAIVAPFGLQLGDAQSARITAALAALGLVAEWIRQAVTAPSSSAAVTVPRYGSPAIAGPVTHEAGIVEPGELELRASENA